MISKIRSARFERPDGRAASACSSRAAAHTANEQAGRRFDHLFCPWRRFHSSHVIRLDSACRPRRSVCSRPARSSTFRFASSFRRNERLSKFVEPTDTQHRRRS